MEKYKIALLGHGFIGSVHREVIEESIPAIEVVAVADTNAEALARVPSSVNTFSDYRGVFSTHPDAVIVALPTRLHREAVYEVVHQGLPMLLEKPLGVAVEDAQDIVAAVRRTEMPAMVGLTGRFHPEFAAAYASLKRGDIGDIVSIQERIHFGIPNFPPCYVTPEHSGRGIGLENGIHTFDRLQYFTGSPIERIEGLTTSNNHLRGSLEDYVAGTAVTASGVRIPFSLRWTEDAEEDYVFQVTGTKGMLKVEGFKQCVLTQRDKASVLYMHDVSRSLRDRHKPGIRDELNHFVRYLNGETDRDFLQDALDAQCAVELIYAQKH